MKTRKSPWILGFLYINPDDARLLVPLPCKLGWAVNFGNPRSIQFVWRVCLGVLLGLLIIPIIAHPAYLAAGWISLLWVFSANVAAIGLIRVNGCFAWEDYRQFPLASFGLVAVSAGFLVQGIINGPLVAWWGLKDLFLAQQLILGFVCGIAQTFGRVVALLLLHQTKPPASARDAARQGLLVGLGFTVVEITFIYFSVAWAQAEMGFVSVWERVSASMFHIYAAGLVGLGLWWRRYVLVALVVAIHGVLDTLALAGGSLGFSVYGLETLFSAIAVLTWVVFLVAARLGDRRDEAGVNVRAE